MALPPPTPDYINYKGLVDTLNLKIEAFNIENGASSAPKLHQTGERPLDKGKKRKYMFNAFREVDKANMMHLKDNKRFKMVKCLVKYFTKATDFGLGGQDGLQAQAAGGEGPGTQILLLVAYHSTCFIITATDSYDRLLPTTALASSLLQTRMIACSLSQL